MLGDVAPLREIAAIKREMGAYLMVDEAHSMGVLGEHGRGLAEATGVEADVDFIVGTFSKSLGSVGGFCVSDLDGFDVLRRSEEHTSELQSLMRISYAVFCLKKKITNKHNTQI